MIVDPDCLVCARCRQPIGTGPIKTTPAVTHETCPEPDDYAAMEAEAYEWWRSQQ